MAAAARHLRHGPGEAIKQRRAAAPDRAQQRPLSGQDMHRLDLRAAAPHILSGRVLIML